MAQKLTALLVFCAGLAFAQVPSPLQLNHPITDRISGGQSRQYQMDLQAGQYLEAVVEQKGIDVVVRLMDPAGNSTRRWPSRAK